MSIDWITVAAQLANFLVLVWLLKRFLYGPILNGIDAREAEIASRMSEASRVTQTAEAEAKQYRDQLARLQADEAEMTETARKNAIEERDKLMAEAHTRLQQERKDFDLHIAGEKRKYIDQLNHAGSNVVLHLARKALTDLADETLEERIASHVVGRLRSMAPDLQKLADGSDEAVMKTNGPLSEPVAQKLKADLRKILPGLAFRFEVDPSQAVGVVLHVGSAQVAWTIDSYVEELDAMMEERLARGRDIGMRAE